MNVTTLNLTPAYGRDYKSKRAVLADWEANKDFISHSPFGTAYVNKADLETLPELENVNLLEFHYHNLGRICCINV